mmetsp:Transcript_11347/g.19853  ORF Transcript_11347/g.19853 Transcript_11347/m.19853 type:complete len:276 (+) Transcript_11347:193-1020(+)
MEAWAQQGSFPRVAFVCIATGDVREARQSCKTFGARLHLHSVLNGYCEAQPRRGQLGCSGFIVLEQNAHVVLPATPSFLQHGPNAHRWVERWLATVPQLAAAPMQLGTALAAPSALAPVPSSTSCETCTMSGSAACAQGSRSNGSIDLRPPASVGHEEMDSEHAACTQALGTALQQPCRKTLQLAYGQLYSHFAHEEKLMTAKAFGGQGSLSGFQSHCQHHAWILGLLLKVRREAQASGLHEEEVMPQAVPVLQETFRAFHSHAEQYDALYAGSL